MNCHSQETIDRFIALRAQNIPFNTIVEELGVAKSTLIRWSREHHHKIHNLRAIEVESAAAKWKMSWQDRFEELGNHLAKVRDELNRRDLSDIPTARLFTLMARLRSEAMRVSSPPPFVEVIDETSPDLP